MAQSRLLELSLWPVTEGCWIWTIFRALKSILSGPAGGVVGYALTSWDEKHRQPIIGYVFPTQVVYGSPIPDRHL